MCFNAIEKLQSVHWDRYSDVVIHGQIASGIIVIISTVALTIIFVSNTYAAHMATHSVTLYSLESTAGLSGAAFILFSCMHYYAVKKLKNDIKNFLDLADIASEEEEEVLSEHEPVSNIVSTTQVVTIPMHEDSLEHITQVVIQPILAELKKMVEAIVIAHRVKHVKTGMKIAKRELKKDLKWAFGDTETPGEIEILFTPLLENHQLFVSEMLRYFGPTKKNANSALRRLISAYNSGDPHTLEKVKKEYSTIICSQNFTEIIAALQSSSNNEELMKKMPALLENLFSLPDEEIKFIGKNVLDVIFNETQNHPEVHDQLNKLREKARDVKEFASNLEQFVNTVLMHANLTHETYTEWGRNLVKLMLHTTLKKRSCRVLGLLSHHLRMLHLLFNKKEDKKNLFIKIDQAFLNSESSDCLKKEKLQTEMFKIQSQINFERSENDRIALLALKKDETKNYQELCAQEAVVRFCFEASGAKMDQKLWENLSSSPEILKLGQEYAVRIVAVPISIEDHPFKKFKEYEGYAWLIPAVKGAIPGLLWSEITKILPKIVKLDLTRFETLFNLIIKLLIDPIYEGMLGDSKFHEAFAKIMTNEGEKLATQLEELIKDEELSIEKIIEVWKNAVRSLTKEFKAVVTMSQVIIS